MFDFTAPIVKCNVCWNKWKAKQSTQFNGCIFLILLFIGIIPWIIYALVFNKKVWVCKNCDSDQIYPVFII